METIKLSDTLKNHTNVYRERQRDSERERERVKVSSGR